MSSIFDRRLIITYARLRRVNLEVVDLRSVPDEACNENKDDAESRTLEYYLYWLDILKSNKVVFCVLRIRGNILGRAALISSASVLISHDDSA